MEKKGGSNEIYRKSPERALLCKRKVGVIKGTEIVPREHYCLKDRWEQ